MEFLLTLKPWPCSFCKFANVTEAIVHLLLCDSAFCKFVNVRGNYAFIAV